MTRAIKIATGTIALLVVAVITIGSIVLWPAFFPDKQTYSATGGKAPGSVLEATPINDLPLALKLLRAKGAYVEYTSTDANGTPTRVSGSVYSPGSEPPDGGWPVIALGHGTLGINEDCAPSRSDTLFGLIGFVQALIAGGYAVAVPDYQGLGTPGTHPYLDNATTGRNIIDAVRATRAVFGNIAPRWAGYGSSQGGGSTWAANEQSASYAPELTLVGTVNAAPTADVSGLVDKARAGTLTADQGPALQWAIEAAARTHRDIDRDDYRRGTAARNWTTLSACSGPLVAQRSSAAKQLGTHDLAPATDAAYTRLKNLLESYAVPKHEASAPMLVIFGDKDSYIDSAWTRAAIARSCALGDTIEADEQPTTGHADVDITAAVGWLVDRFADKPAPTDCPR